MKNALAILSPPRLASVVAITLALPLLLSIGCAKKETPCVPPSGAPVESALPRLDETWQIATHNSYWVDRGVQGDVSASGVEERLVDQVLVDHARGLELDIHQSATVVGGFDVFHTIRGNSLCDTLAECLTMLRAIDYALPQHEVITIVLELKELFSSNFGPDDTVQDLDQVLLDGLGTHLYTPADLLARCSAKNFCTDNVADCVAAVGWPPVDELRGKFVVGVMGNWDNAGAISTADWATYALTGPVTDRAAFPMVSSWKLDWTTLPADDQAAVTQAQLDEAFARSGLMQTEDITDPKLAPWIAGHGVVRIDGAELPADEEARAALGAELLQTDYPWNQFDDLGPAIPFRSFRSGDAPSLLREPGDHSLLLPPAAGARVFAYNLQPANQGDTELESTIGSGATADAIGCLRAAAALGQTNETSISLCRVKIAAERTADETGAADAETVIGRIIECTAGVCSSTDVPEAGGHDAPGDLMQLEIKSNGQGGSCATARAAASIDSDLNPIWVDLAPAFCATSPLVYQGISRAAPADPTSTAMAHFVGTRRDGVDLISSSYSAVVSEPPANASDPAPAPAPSLLVTP